MTKRNDLDALAVKRMQQIDEEIASGKRKVISEKEVLKKYPYLEMGSKANKKAAQN